LRPCCAIACEHLRCDRELACAARARDRRRAVGAGARWRRSSPQGYDAELDELRNIDAGCAEFLVDLERRERERSGIANLKVEYNRVHGFYIEVTRANSERVPAITGGARRSRMPSATRRRSSRVRTKALTAEERARACERRLYEALLTELAPAIPALQEVAAALGTLDVLQALAERAQALRLVRPRFTDDTLISITHGRHPSWSAGRAFIPNDCRWTRRGRMLIITGPEHGRKVDVHAPAAVIALLACCGMYVPAADACIGPLDAIFTRIGAADDLGRRAARRSWSR
jgi:DNA mismatch repair protein MutS